MLTGGKEACASAHLAVDTSINSLICTPEANMLHVNYTSVGGGGVHMVEKPGMRLRTASHLPRRHNLCMLSLRREGAGSHQGCGKQGTVSQKPPQGPIRKARTESLRHPSIRLVLHTLQKQLWGCSASTTPQGYRERWRIQGKPRSFVLFCFFKGNMEEGLGFNQPVPYGLWGILFFHSQVCWAECTFPTFLPF